MSSVAGCLAGIFYLYFTHGFVAAPEPAYQRMSTSAQAVATERNDAQSAALDADTTKEREDALSAYDDGNFVAAEQQINDALTMARNKHEKIGEGLLLADLCMIEIEQHKLSDAYEAGNTGLQILDGNPFVSKKDLSFALRGFGTACFYRGDYKVAEGSLKRSVDLDRGIYGQADERYAIGLGRLAKVYESDKKPDLAEKYYRQALAVSERAHQKGDPHLSTRLGSFAKFLRSRHRIIEAVALERRAREVDK